VTAATNERRVNGSGLSPREAAFVTELSEKTINQAIDRAEVEPLPARRMDDRERMLGFPDLVYLRMRGQVGDLLSSEGKRRLRQELLVHVQGNKKVRFVHIGPLRVDVAAAVDEMMERMAEIPRLWSFITVDPNVRAGEPVVRGTRIGVHTLADLARQGASTEELLEDYPALTAEGLEAALAWARMYPRRGRPPTSAWQGGTVIRRGS
jgi:uncharacterized protein (DUF433 family)